MAVLGSMLFDEQAVFEAISALETGISTSILTEQFSRPSAA
jgi:hypothetical protein